MKQNLFLLRGLSVFGVLALLSGTCLTSCTSPEVATNILMSYPPVVEADSVAVYGPVETPPADAMRLGTVTVFDNGFSTHCHYDQVVALARQKTAEVGGNALHVVKHVNPSFWGSTCHQIVADMLLTGKIEIDSVDFNAYAKAALQEEAEAVVRQQQLRAPANTVSLGAGMAIPLTTVVLDGRSHHGNIGTDFAFSYHHIFKKGLGFGASYLHHHGRYRGLGPLSLQYVGADVVFSTYCNTRRKWLGDISWGLGYARYDVDGWNHGGGIGMRGKAGLEYLLNKHFGIAVELNSLTTAFSTPEGVIVKDERNFGFTYDSIVGSLRFHF